MAPLLLLLQLMLSFTTGQPLSPLTLVTAIAEADSLWSPYGVSIAAAPRIGSADADDCRAPVLFPVLRVAVADSLRAPGVQPAPDRPRRPGTGAALGAISFRDDRTPSPLIWVFLGDIQRLIAGIRLLGARQSQWPPMMRERILGRVIGRVLAHEIGHYLLRTPGHASAGLMRPVHATPTLVAPERRPFTLTKPEASRLGFQPPALPGAVR